MDEIREPTPEDLRRWELYGSLAPIVPNDDLIERLQAFASELRAQYPGSDIDDALERIRRFMAGESDDTEQ